MSREDSQRTIEEKTRIDAGDKMRDMAYEFGTAAKMSKRNHKTKEYA